MQVVANVKVIDNKISARSGMGHMLMPVSIYFHNDDCH